MAFEEPRMSSSCSSSSFCVLRPTEIVKFLVVYLEVQRFLMKGWRFESRLRHSLHFNFGFFSLSRIPTQHPPVALSDRETSFSMHRRLNSPVEHAQTSRSGVRLGRVSFGEPLVQGHLWRVKEKKKKKKKKKKKRKLGHNYPSSSEILFSNSLFFLSAYSTVTLYSHFKF